MSFIDWNEPPAELEQLLVDIQALRRRRIAAEAAAAGRKRRLQRLDVIKSVQATINPNK